MNAASFLRLCMAGCLVALLSGCSSVLLNRMPDVNQYSWEPHRTFARAEVVEALGQPVRTTTFPRPLTVATLAARKHPAFSRPRLAAAGQPALQGHVADRAARVGTVDEYVLRGPVLATGGDLLSVVWAKQLAVVTLGLSELYFFPATVGWFVSARKDVYHLYMAYSPSRKLVAHRLLRMGQ